MAHNLHQYNINWCAFKIIDNRESVNYRYAYLEYVLEYDLQLGFLFPFSGYLKNNSVTQVAIHFVHQFFINVLITSCFSFFITVLNKITIVILI